MSKIPFFQRISMAMGLILKGSAGDVAEHFRRVAQGSNGGTGRPGKPYEQVTAVRAAVSRKARCLASMPMMISTAEDQLIESGPLFDLLEQPNARMGRREFWIQTSGWLDLSGACHWIMNKRTWRGLLPTEVIPVGAWQMKPILDRNNDLAGWKYRAAGQRWDQAVELDLTEVWTVGLSSFDPTEPFGYSAPLKPAMMAVAQLYKSDVANEASLDNGVEPGGVFTSEGTPTEDQIKDMRQQLAERHSGAANRRRHLLLYGGMKWESIAATFSEMEFVELQKMKIVDVCVALDVDPAAIGYYENSNYAHAESAKNSMWIDTCIPLGEWLADEFERGVVSRFTKDKSLTARHQMQSAVAAARKVHRRQRSSIGFLRAKSRSGSALTVWFDDSRIAAVRKAQLDRSKEGAIWIKDYLSPPGDVIEALDLPLEVHPHQKVAWQTTSVMPVDAAPLFGDEDDDEGEIPGETGSDGQTQSDDSEEDLPNQGNAVAIERELTVEQRVRLHELWEASWAGIARSMAGRVARHFLELRAEVLAKVAQVNPGGEPRSVAITRSIIGEMLFDIFIANQKLAAAVRPLVRASFELGGQQSLDEAAVAEGKEPKDADVFRIQDPQAVAAMKAREIKITDTNRTVRKHLAESISQGMEKGETTAEIQERVRTTFNMAGKRSATIARTEVGGAVEQSRQMGRAQANVPMKSWLSGKGDSMREWHLLTEFETFKNPVANDALFVIAQTGNTAMHPRASGIAEEDINCRCTTVARYPNDQVKDLRLIRHLKAHGFRTPGGDQS